MIPIAFVVLVFMAAGGPLQRVDLKMPGRVTDVVPADVNGDGEKDLLVFWRQGFPPESVSRVSVFLSENSRIAPRPGQVLALPEKTVAYDVGDSNADGHADLLLLRSDGVWSLNGEDGGLSTRGPVPVVKVMTVASFPHEDNIPRIELLFDLDESRKGLLIPTVPIGPLALYGRDAKGHWTLVQVLRVPTRTNLYTSAVDFRATRDYGAMFQIVFPRWSVADQNGDGRRDLFFFSQDAVAVFRARKEGTFPKDPDFYRIFGLLDPKDRIKRGVLVRAQAGDIDGDKRADLLFNKTVGGISNMQSELRLYRGQPGGGYPAKADFVSEREGWGSSARLMDVDGDGRMDLIRPHVEMGITALIGMMLAGKLEVTFGVHLAKDGGFREQADFQLPSKLRIDFTSNQELTGPYPDFQADFDGDGTRDLVIGRAGGGSGDEPDRLEIRPGKGQGRFSSDPMWTTDLNGTRYVVPFCFRPKERSSLVIYFSSIEDRKGDVWVFHNTGPWR
jgi:hypothetical protein